jgi:hypothetical protein
MAETQNLRLIAKRVVGLSPELWLEQRGRRKEGRTERRKVERGRDGKESPIAGA